MAPIVLSFILQKVLTHLFTLSGREWLICSQTTLLIPSNGLSADFVSLSALKRHKQINPAIRINSFITFIE